jgi:hypothetical protein
MTVQYPAHHQPHARKKSHLPPEVRAQIKEDNLQVVKRFHEDLVRAQEQIEEMMVKISQDHNKSLEVVAEQLHLGGHAIKQQRGPGINNAVAFCSARVENECTFICIIAYNIVLI